MFIRYVAADTRSENPWLCNGVICSVDILIREKRLSKEEKREAKKAFHWFNNNLVCPPFRANLKSKTWTEDAVAWFRPSAKQYIAALKPFFKLLRQHKFIVKTIKTTYPGKIVYRDKFQVVAETPKKHLK